MMSDCLPHRMMSAIFVAYLLCPAIAAAQTPTVGNFAEPVSIGVDCEPTPNLLRFICKVTVDPPQSVEVRYQRTDGLGIQRANRSDVIAGSHEVPLLFLAQKSEYWIEATAQEHPLGRSATEALITGALPPKLDSYLRIHGESTMKLVGGMIPCNRQPVAVIYDTDTGDLVWYEVIGDHRDGTFDIGNMVRFTDEQTVLGMTGTRIIEEDLLGEEITNFSVDFGRRRLHHDIFKADGNYYGIAKMFPGNYELDRILVFDPQGNQILQWTYPNHLIPSGKSGDWFHTNSIWVEEDGTVLLSWHSRDSVAKIDLRPESPTLGDVLWIMDGNPPDFYPPDIVIDWSAVPLPHKFDRQHNFHRRHDGRYMLLDNIGGRGIVFTIDEQNRTATADVVYPTQRPSCAAQGTATDTENGNAVVGCDRAYLREYDGTTDEPIWQAKVKCSKVFAPWVGSERWYPLDHWSDEYLPTASIATD